jgi:hypothetical protein
MTTTYNVSVNLTGDELALLTEALRSYRHSLGEAESDCRDAKDEEGADSFHNRGRDAFYLQAKLIFGRREAA